MSAAGTNTVRNLTKGDTTSVIDTSDMPSGALTVQHILDRAGIDASTSSVMVEGRRTPTSATVETGTELVVVPNVANG